MSKADPDDLTKQVLALTVYYRDSAITPFSEKYVKLADVLRILKGKRTGGRP